MVENMLAKPYFPAVVGQCSQCFFKILLFIDKTESDDMFCATCYILCILSALCNDKITEQLKFCDNMQQFLSEKCWEHFLDKT